MLQPIPTSVWKIKLPLPVNFSQIILVQLLRTWNFLAFNIY